MTYEFKGQCAWRPTTVWRPSGNRMMPRTENQYRWGVDFVPKPTRNLTDDEREVLINIIKFIFLNFYDLYKYIKLYFNIKLF